MGKTPPGTELIGAAKEKIELLENHHGSQAPQGWKIRMEDARFKNNGPVGAITIIIVITLKPHGSVVVDTIIKPSTSDANYATKSCLANHKSIWTGYMLNHHISYRLECQCLPTGTSTTQQDYGYFGTQQHSKAKEWAKVQDTAHHMPKAVARAPLLHTFTAPPGKGNITPHTYPNQHQKGRMRPSNERKLSKNKC